MVNYAKTNDLIMDQNQMNYIMNYIMEEYPGGVSYTISQIMKHLPKKFCGDDIDEAIGELVEDDLKHEGMVYE